MSNEKMFTALKWGTVVILALSAVFFFLPHRFDLTPLGMLDMFDHTDDIIEVVLRYIVPAGLMVLAAILMALKYGIVKCVLAVILCGIAFGLYILDIRESGEVASDIGLIMNRIIAVAGIILPVCNIVVRKVFATKESA